MAAGTGVGQGKMKNEVGNIKVVSVVSLSGSSGGGQPHPATFRTRKCACCCSTIATNYGSNIPGRPSQPLAKPKTSVHEMLSTIFCYPRGLTTEEELQCCSKCTLLMQQGFAWSQALKKVLSVESKIHSLLEIIQKQNLSIRRVMSVPVTAFDSGHQPTTNTTEAGTSTGMSTSTPLNVIRIQKRKQCHPVSTITPISTLSAPTTTTSTITQTTNSFSIRLPPTQKFIKYQNVVATTIVSPKGPSFSEEKQDRKTGTRQEKKEVRPWEFENADDVVALFDSDDEPETDPFAYDADGVRQDSLASTSQDRRPPTGKRVRPTTWQQTVLCNVHSCDATFKGISSERSEWLKDHMETVHPYFACCELCESDVYGTDEQSTRELLVKHHSEKHASAQNPIPAPTLETVTTYPVYTKIYSCTCQFCPLRFHSSLDNRAAAKLRKAHTISQHKTSRQCPQCPTVLNGDPSSLSKRLRKHIAIRHELKPKFICEICERPLPTGRRKVKMIHTMTHMNKEELEAEIEKNPSIRKTTLCPICGLVLQSKRGVSEEHILKNHMRVHSETTTEKPIYPCDQCDYSSASRKTTERHKLIHVEGGYCKFTCKRCGKGYLAGQGREYKDHIMVCCDEKERPVQCPEPGCFKRFKLKQTAMLHLMLCHKKTPEDAREIIYPGLPVHDWVRTMTMTRKWKGKRKGKEEEGSSGDVSQMEVLPEVPVEMEEDGNPVNIAAIARRSLRNWDKMMRLDL